MLLNKNIALSLFILLLLQGCIDPFTPGDLKFENMLFIEAHVTDDPELPPIVRISHAYPLEYDNYEGEPMANIYGANVYIEDDNGARYYFSQEVIFHYKSLIGPQPGYNPGVTYTLSEPGFELTEGRSYRLQIETDDGYIFESEYEKYLPSPPIQDITWGVDRWETKESGDQDEGYRFYISSASVDNEPLFLRWKPDATYKYSVPFLASYRWNGISLDQASNTDIMVCYKDERINGIFTGTSEGLEENRVVDAPLHTVSRVGDRLQITYSLHVKQMRISQGAYQFWKDLQTLLYETGGLYESVPFRLSGNIQCTSHDDFNLAGVFEVAGVSETRAFVPRNYDDFTVDTYRCVADTIGTADLPWDKVPSGSWIREDEPEVYLTAPATCFDCRVRGGYTQQPAFWEN
ncbi:MAG: DUF4249 domain-containing protein [Bacteroidales bacterium]|nr:DUF4249 domain-containing protein [Bacteroidales bacterium]